MQQSFYKKESLIAMFLDIKEAFDNVIPYLLIEDLVQLGIPSEYIQFYRNLVFRRNFISLNLEKKKNHFLFLK